MVLGTTTTTDDPLTSCEGESSPYLVTLNAYYLNGTPYAANSGATLAQCKAACENTQGLPACLGFDYS